MDKMEAAPRRRREQTVRARAGRPLRRGSSGSRGASRRTRQLANVAHMDPRMDSCSRRPRKRAAERAIPRRGSGHADPGSPPTHPGRNMESVTASRSTREPEWRRCRAAGGPGYWRHQIRSSRLVTLMVERRTTRASSRGQPPVPDRRCAWVGVRRPMGGNTSSSRRANSNGRVRRRRRADDRADLLGRDEDMRITERFTRCLPTGSDYRSRVEDPKRDAARDAEVHSSGWIARALFEHACSRAYSSATW